jgi:hypothetical protein
LGFLGEIYLANRARPGQDRNPEEAAMLGNVLNSMEQMSLPPEWQELAQENGSLRAIIVELLIKNQNLRWELSLNGLRPVQDPRVLMASEGTP